MQYENMNSQDYSLLNSSAITHDRNQSLQNTTPGAINMSAFTQQESALNPINSGHRKPTADSTSYTLYKPNGKTNQRIKYQNGNLIDEADP